MLLQSYSAFIESVLSLIQKQNWILPEARLSFQSVSTLTPDIIYSLYGQFLLKQYSTTPPLAQHY